MVPTRRPAKTLAVRSGYRALVKSAELRPKRPGTVALGECVEQFRPPNASEIVWSARRLLQNGTWATGRSSAMSVGATPAIDRAADRSVSTFGSVPWKGSPSSRWADQTRGRGRRHSLAQHKRAATGPLLPQ